MPIEVLMPALSPTMEKGNLAKWLKKEGDKVKPGDVIAEIETDKATMEYEAVDEGTLAKIVVPEGTQDVPVNQLIAVLAGEGEDVRAAAAAVPSVPKAPASVAPPAADLRPAPVVAAAIAPAASAGRPAQGSNRVFASPLARRLAKDAGLALDRLRGSGPHGRIIARDVETAKSGKGPAADVAARPAIQALSDDKIKALFEPGAFDVVPHDNMRKVIARRLVEAKT